MSGGAPQQVESLPADATATNGVGVVDTTVPRIAIAADAKPFSQLVTRDLTVGTGAEATAGAQVVVNYCLVGLTGKTLIDSSWANGSPITIGLDRVIKGWKDGVSGMKAGGRRLIIIPGDLGYGPNPDPRSGIQPNETLVFVVDLIDIP